jgi:hypothetical protein
MKFLALFALPLALQAQDHLAAVQKLWKPASGVTLSAAAPTLVPPKENAAFPTKLGPVFLQKLVAAKGQAAGYLLWETDANAGLLEFTIDAPGNYSTDVTTLPEVPPLQQFAIPGEEAGPPIASGCVPTAAGSFIGYWAKHGHPEWLGKGDLKAATLRIRARLPMKLFPDQDGFTDDGMTLAGAFPSALAKALEADAEAHAVPLEISLHRFQAALVENEIQQKRPVLLSCQVHLPHKPQLSWGHEVIGCGELKLGGRLYIGVSDNFLPLQHPNTLRWLRADVFDSLILAQPRLKASPPAQP